MSERSAVAMSVRVYELDMQGHLNSAVYHQWAEHARWMHLTALGIPPDLLLASGVGPVFLEERIRYHRELRLGDEVTVTCELLFEDTPRRTFRVRQQFLVADDTVAAELGSVCGLLDLDQRRLLEDPRAHLESLTRPPIATRGTT